MNHTLTTEPGEIRVNHHQLVVNDPNVKVWHIDLDSKYAEILAYSRNHEDGVAEVMVCANECTLRIDETKRGTPTVFRLPLDNPDRWSVIAECARYTVRIVAYRESQDAQ